MMVPPGFTTFFATGASAGAALVGLLFVAVSIAPHETVKASAPIERQAISSSAFTALVNAFFICMSALIPGSNVGTVGVLLGALGMLNTLSLTRHLVREGWHGWKVLGQRGLLVAAGLIIYSYEIYFAISLLLAPNDRGPLYGLMGLLISVYGLGIVRAWQLLGAQHFSILSGFLGMLPGPKEPPAEADARQHTEKDG